MSTELQNLMDTLALLDEVQESLNKAPLYAWGTIERAKYHINEQVRVYFEEAAA